MTEDGLPFETLWVDSVFLSFLIFMAITFFIPSFLWGKLCYEKTALIIISTIRFLL